MGIPEKIGSALAAMRVPAEIRAVEMGIRALASDDIQDKVRRAHEQRYSRLVKSDVAPLPGEDPKTDRQILESLIIASRPR